jgi:hypothetical protein
MGFVDPGICVQLGGNHDSIDEIIDHRGNAVDPPSRS